MRDSSFSAMVRAVHENHHKHTKCYKRISINMAKSGNNINRSEEEGRAETLNKNFWAKQTIAPRQLATPCNVYLNT